MPVTTDRLVLRRREDSDAESLYEYARDPDIGLPAGRPPHKSTDENCNVIANVFCGSGCCASKPLKRNALKQCFVLAPEVRKLVGSKRRAYRARRFFVKSAGINVPVFRVVGGRFATVKALAAVDILSLMSILPASFCIKFKPRCALHIGAFRYFLSATKAVFAIAAVAS